MNLSCYVLLRLFSSLYIHIWIFYSTRFGAYVIQSAQPMAMGTLLGSSNIAWHLKSLIIDLQKCPKSAPPSYRNWSTYRYARMARRDPGTSNAPCIDELESNTHSSINETPYNSSPIFLHAALQGSWKMLGLRNRTLLVLMVSKYLEKNYTPKNVIQCIAT